MSKDEQRQARALRAIYNEYLQAKFELNDVIAITTERLRLAQTNGHQLAALITERAKITGHLKTLDDQVTALLTTSKQKK